MPSANFEASVFHDTFYALGLRTVFFKILLEYYVNYVKMKKTKEGSL